MGQIVFLKLVKSKSNDIKLKKKKAIICLLEKTAAALPTDTA